MRTMRFVGASKFFLLIGLVRLFSPMAVDALPPLATIENAFGPGDVLLSARAPALKGGRCRGGVYPHPQPGSLWPTCAGGDKSHPLRKSSAERAPRPATSPKRTSFYLTRLCFRS